MKVRLGLFRLDRIFVLIIWFTSSLRPKWPQTFCSGKPIQRINESVSVPGDPPCKAISCWCLTTAESDLTLMRPPFPCNIVAWSLLVKRLQKDEKVHYHFKLIPTQGIEWAKNESRMVQENRLPLLICTIPYWPSFTFHATMTRIKMAPLHSGFTCGWKGLLLNIQFFRYSNVPKMTTLGIT